MFLAEGISFFREKTNRYLFILFCLFGGLMFSKAILSISVGALLVNWLADKDIHQKIQNLFRNKVLLVFLSIFILHVVGLAWSSDLSYAFKDLKVKLPLLIFPVVFATEKPFSKAQFTIILHFLLSFITVSALVSVYLYLVSDNFTLRAISPFMSHIRLSLLTTIASFFMFYLFLKSENKLKIYPLLMLAGSLFHAIFTIMILGSFNGVIFFGFLLIFWLIVLIFKTRNKVMMTGLIALILCIVAGFSIYVLRIHNMYFPSKKKMPTELPEKTKQGNPYIHEHESPIYENGIPLYGFYCLKELKNEWNKRSNIKIGEAKDSIYAVHDILIRYLTSKDLPKDSLGISQLSETDIRNIEHGITNYRLVGKSPLEFRLYELFYGYYTYRYFKKEYNNSLFLRVEYVQTALGIIRNHPVFGVGTGDVNIAFAQQYEITHSILEPELRRRAHNQFLSITVAFGIFGLIIFIFALIWPAYKLKKFNSFYFVTAWLALMLSMLSEDTIETQVGVTIFSFFYSFFLFADPGEK